MVMIVDSVPAALGVYVTVSSNTSSIGMLPLAGLTEKFGLLDDTVMSVSSYWLPSSVKGCTTDAPRVAVPRKVSSSGLGVS